MERRGVAHPHSGAPRTCAQRASSHRHTAGQRADVRPSPREPERLAVSRDGARASRVRRLLFVGTNSGPGGTESHFISLAIAMADAGFDVAAVARPDDYIANALAADGRVSLFPAVLEPGAVRRATVDLTRICREAQPDWLIGSFAREYWPLSVVGRRQRIPV